MNSQMKKKLYFLSGGGWEPVNSCVNKRIGCVGAVRQYGKKRAIIFLGGRA